MGLNVVVFPGKKGTLKLTDFGFAKIAQGRDTLKTPCYTPYYVGGWFHILLLDPLFKPTLFSSRSVGIQEVRPLLWHLVPRCHHLHFVSNKLLTSFQWNKKKHFNNQVVWVPSFFFPARPSHVPWNEKENPARPVRLPQTILDGRVQRGQGADQWLPQDQPWGEADHRPSDPDKMGFGE